MLSLLSILRRRPRLTLIALGVLLVLGAGLWWFPEISNGYISTRDLLVHSMAFGILPPLLWTLALSLAVWKRRSLLRWRLWHWWLAALLASPVAWGVLAYFSNYSGILGEVSLGGWVGQGVKGSSDVLGALRLVGMTALVAAVAFPIRSLRLSKAAFVWGGRAGRAMLRLVGRVRLPRPGLKVPRVPVPGKPRDGVGRPGARKRETSPRPTITVQRAPAPMVEGRPLDTESPQESWTPGGARPEAPTEEKASSRPWSPGGARAEASSEGRASSRPSTPRGARAEAPSEGRASPRPWSPGGARPEAPSEEKASSQPSGPATASRPQPEQPRRAPRESTGNWLLPSLSLLSEPPRESGKPGIDQEGTARLIEKTLGEYGIEVKVTEVKPGPVVTMFGLVPGWVRRSRQVKEMTAEGRPAMDAAGKSVVRRVEDRTRVKVDSIVAREKDLAMALAAPSLRIEAPIPGASLVGIEVPNPHPAVVALRSVIESEAFQALRSKSRLAVALGEGNGGEVAVADLARMPHLLIAGTTGSGKSVCMNSIISCIIMHNSPWDVRLLMIDPKRVELTPYNGIPHLPIPVVVDVEMAVQALKGMIREMHQRYRRMEEAGARNIEGYNRRLPPEERMPLVVVAVDELADLMISAPHDVEHSIIRLAQLGRSTGIHLVVATQRPSVDVVTGLIKANFPSRIGFAVVSQVDSRTILDAVGAEKLLGRGDMLFLPQDASKPKRVQGTFITDKDIEELVGYWRGQHGPPPPEMPLLEAGEYEEEEREGGRGDELLDRAYDLATQFHRLSTSLLQRRLSIGYPRAARLMDLLEEEGVVGPGEPGKSRDVLGSGDRKRNRGGLGDGA